MSDIRSDVAKIDRSVDAGLRNLVRFGTQEQAEQANRAREKLRLATMDQALASLESRNAAILELVSSLQAIVEGLRRHPVGDALQQFRSAVAESQLLLDNLQRSDDAEPAAAPGSAAPASGAEPSPVRPTPVQPPPAQPAAVAASTDAPAAVVPVSQPTAEPERASSPMPATAERPSAPASAGAEPQTVPTPAPSELKLAPANEPFRAALLKAAGRCGLAPSALAALIDAEAAKRPDGGWDPNSANPRSSARGLTQFLSATWIGMAQRNGTFLNGLARSRGCIDDRGEVIPSRRADLLDLRFDPEASIVTAGDFAEQNLSFLAANSCIPANATDDEKARIAYLAHHEGPGGARDFLRGSLADDRAERLLRVNAGSKAASLREEHGSWRSAYTAFLNGYIDRKITPARFRP